VQTKNYDSAKRSAARLRCLSELPGIRLINYELTDVLNIAASALKDAKGTPLCLVMQDSSITLFHLLITDLTLTCVEERICRFPTVPIAMLFTAGSVGEHEHIW
jgi:hypothetical protein